MPPPRVICCICGQEVNKAQTLHIGDGKRACRTHDGTVEKNKLEIDKLKREKEAEIKKATQKKQRKEFTVKPKCVLCGQVGMLQEDWYTRLMIEMKKYELTHGKHINPFSDEIKRAANVLVGIPCLFYVMWRGKNTHIKIPFDAYEFVKMQQMMNPVADPVLLICQNCVTEKGFTTYSQERQDSMGELFLHAAQLIHVVIPEIEKAAIREITESN